MKRLLPLAGGQQRRERVAARAADPVGACLDRTQKSGLGHDHRLAVFSRSGNAPAVGPERELRLELLKRLMPRAIQNRLQAILTELRVRRAEVLTGRFVRPTGRPHVLPGELIVCLTSYPPRFHALAKTLKSLLAQDVLADRTILWLADSDLQMLPGDVLQLTAFGLEIRTCEDIGSYKKIVPALREFPDAFVVTADDDIYYPPDWLSELVGGVRPGEKLVVCRRAHRPLGKLGDFAPYSQWEWEIKTDEGVRDDLFPTGGAGALYPPGSLAPEVLSIEDFKELCPTADDVWLYCMAKRAGTLHRQVGGRFRLINWRGTQDNGLEHYNVLNGNDDQLRRVWAKFCSHLSE